MQVTLAAQQAAQAKADAANAQAQAALNQAKAALANAQQLQDQYASLVAQQTSQLAQSAATKVAADPYASANAKAAAQAAAAQAATPVIILNGGATITRALGQTWVDPGVTVMDDVYTNLAASVKITGSVNTLAVGSNVLLYDVTDPTGYKATQVSRIVNVVKDTVPPVIPNALNKTVFNLALGATFSGTQAITASDNIDGNILTTVTGTVNMSAVGTYKVTHTVTDSSGNTATLVYTVNVADVTPPTIALNGASTMSLTINSAFTDPGVTVSDNWDKGLKATVTGAVNTAALGTYTLTYNAKDAAGNAATAVTRTINVVAKPKGVTVTIFNEAVMYPLWNSSTPTALTPAEKQALVAKGAIAGAKVVVDNGGAASTYTTDVYGQVVIPGVSVGLHDFAVFADGYTWAAINQVTLDPTQKNQWSIPPLNTPNNNNGQSSHLALSVNLPAPAPANSIVELVLTDAKGNVYRAPATGWNNTTQTNNLADFQVYNMGANQTLAGVLTAREITCDIYGMNCNETNAGSLGKVSFTTQPWSSNNTPAGTVNVTYSPTHVTKPIVVSNVANPVIALNISNSTAAPGSVTPSGTNVGIQLNFTYADSYGTAQQGWGWLTNIHMTSVQDPYTGTWVQKVAPGLATGQLNLPNALPVGTVIQAKMTATDTPWNGNTGSSKPVNFVDLGVQTITVEAGSYPGFPVQQPLPASALKTQINVAFPAVAPTPMPVLTVQSLVPPVGITLDQGMGVNNWSQQLVAGNTVPYFNDWVNAQWDTYGNLIPIAFPHKFTSYQAITGKLNFYANGSGTVPGVNWTVDQDTSVGGVVSFASQITTPLNVSPYQTGNIIKVIPFNGGAVKAGEITLRMNDPYTSSTIWNITVPSNATSITLPAVPAGVVNPMVKGKSYSLDVSGIIPSGPGAPVDLTQWMYLNINGMFGGNYNPGMFRETYNISNIPYKY